MVSSWGDSSPSANGQLAGTNASGGPFTSIAGIAVGQSGDLFVYSPGNTNNWFEFDSSGNALSTVSDFYTTDNVGIGVDSAGNLYKVQGNGALAQLSPTGSRNGVVSDDQTSGGQINGFAIDPGNNDVYADDSGTLIRRYAGSSLASCVPAGSCAAEETFGSGNLSSAAGVAVNSATGAVYAADPGANDIAVFTVVPAAAPSVDGESVSGVSTSEATLHAQVNPETLQTSCSFEYGTDTSYSGGSVPCTPAELGTGFSDVAVSAYINGLQPNTTYHFRVVVTNTDGTTDGPDQTFLTYPTPVVQSCPNAKYRTGYSTALPDCRAYEQVTPVEKNGTDAGSDGQRYPVYQVRVSADGDAVDFFTDGPYGPAFTDCQQDPYLGQRTSSGWSTTPMLPPLTGRATGGLPCGELPGAFSPDGTQLVFQNVGDQFDNTSGNNLYLYRSTGSVSNLVSVTWAPMSSSAAGQRISVTWCSKRRRS